jgi:beta-galactosidase
MRLGVCYYPEHWPQEMWADDARKMVEMGLSRVRIGEFAWSRIEQEAGRYDWGWLDQAVEVLHKAGLGIIMGTPTATPPKWLVDQMPDMIALDAKGHPRTFGSRRHYCFSYTPYHAECARIVTAMAQRYGTHPGIVAWQTDNEYGCHDTVVSFSKAALHGFRRWLSRKYGNIGALNAAWGTVFWSMEYRHFDEIDLPHQTVTEANPAHWLDFRRFSSDQVVAFNRVQVDILREQSPGRDLVHNYMGFFTEFDHHDIARDLDVASWDSYPLGFLEQFWFSTEDKLKYLRQGHPDIAAFHHDLYRGCNGGRWWVMEQQPGPVNLARYNPAPLPGMVRLWTLEAMAHGAELVSYFRWRQFPKAQEQMHAGLNRPDNSVDVGRQEAMQAAQDVAALGNLGSTTKHVALVFSYEGDWVTQIQPQGQNMHALRFVFEMYTGLRRLGLNVDILSPDANLDGYAMVVFPCLPIVDDALTQRLAAFKGPVLIGPRTGSKTRDFAIPENLPPGPLSPLLKLRVDRVESLRPGVVERGDGWTIHSWLEHVSGEAAVEHRLDHRISNLTHRQGDDPLNFGQGIVFKQDQYRYLAAWPDGTLLALILKDMTQEAALSPHPVPESLRICFRGDTLFVFNYDAQEQDFTPPAGYTCILGETPLPPAGVAVFRQATVP